MWGGRHDLRAGREFGWVGLGIVDSMLILILILSACLASCRIGSARRRQCPWADGARLRMRVYNLKPRAPAGWAGLGAGRVHTGQISWWSKGGAKLPKMPAASTKPGKKSSRRKGGTRQWNIR